MRYGECVNPSRKTPKSLKQVATCQLLNARQHVRVSGVLEVTVVLCQSRCREKVKICSPLPVIVTSPYELNNLEWDETTQTNKKCAPWTGCHDVALQMDSIRSIRYWCYSCMYMYYIYSMRLKLLCIKQQIMIIPILFL